MDSERGKKEGYLDAEKWILGSVQAANPCQV